MSEVAPILRGAASLKDERIEGAWRRLVMEFRGGDAVLAFVNGREVARYARAGVVTPDHVLRVKPWPLIVPAPEAGKLDAFKGAARSAVADFIAAYRATSSATPSASASRASCSILCRA